ncbi:MAG: hypothetical protein ABIQ58_01540, partial [Candidatus Limnocylindrales bacterium]
GIPWLSIPTMASTHGALNVLGFAVPAAIAWTLDLRPAGRWLGDGERDVPRRPRQGRARRWMAGLLVGSVFGVGTLIGGPLLGGLGIVALLLVAAEPRREAPVGGALTGLGGSLFALFASARARCGAGCEMPDMTPWLLFSGAALAIGVVLTIRAART